MEVGRGKGVWGRDPQNKHLQSAHVLLRVSPHQCPPSVPLTDVSSLPPGSSRRSLRAAGPPSGLGMWLFSQILRRWS